MVDLWQLWEGFTDLTPYAPLFAGVAGGVIAIGLIGIVKGIVIAFAERRSRKRLIARTRAIARCE
ncbi:hypothetical protein [Escherichia coli]|uniref:hypothetical protein n=1 Tax=Escherichia coli TaxID=562 RepID=UPI000BE8D461|nr:hypothetical protein [Escherichia coli]